MRPGTCSRLGRVRPRTPFRHPVLAMALGLERHPAVVVPSVNGLSRYSRVTRLAQRAGQGIQSIGCVCEPATRAPGMSPPRLMPAAHGWGACCPMSSADGFFPGRKCSISVPLRFVRECRGLCGDCSRQGGAASLHRNGSRMVDNGFAANVLHRLDATCARVAGQGCDVSGRLRNQLVRAARLP